LRSTDRPPPLEGGAEIQGKGLEVAGRTDRDCDGDTISRADNEPFPAEIVWPSKERLMRGSSRSLILSVMSCAAGWLIATLFRRRALISVGRARVAISRSCSTREAARPSNL
jgi:hypothetical protein